MRIELKDLDEWIYKNQETIDITDSDEDYYDLERFGRLWEILRKYNIEEDFDWTDGVIVICTYPEYGMEEQDLLDLYHLGFNIDEDKILYGCF